ncbi:MAG: domain S-box protein [Conexibacter sp.]|nr:domain S-box protein [Conexibacter sp.]
MQGPWPADVREALEDVRCALARAEDPPDGSPRDDVLVGALTRIGRELRSAVDDLRPADGAPVRVLLVEDHAAVRDAFAAALRREPDLEVVGEAGTLAEARGMLAEVDVALVDLGLPDGDGSDLVAALREAEPGAHAIVLSAGSDHSAVARAVERGAAGALSKADRLPDVIDAIRRVGAGEALLPLDEVVELLRFAGRERERELLDRQAIERLTSRELEILQLIADGCDGRDAASRLHISVRTQRNHVANILGKLGVHSQLQALIFALRHQLVELVPRGRWGE